MKNCETVVIKELLRMLNERSQVQVLPATLNGSCSSVGRALKSLFKTFSVSLYLYGSVVIRGLLRKGAKKQPTNFSSILYLYELIVRLELLRKTNNFKVAGSSPVSKSLNASTVAQLVEKNLSNQFSSVLSYGLIVIKELLRALALTKNTSLRFSSVLYLTPPKPNFLLTT